MISGDFEGKCVRLEFGGDKNDKPMIRGEMKVVGGPHDGATVPYDGKLDEKGIKWTRRDMLALGWQGKDIRTLIDDVKRADKTVPFRVEIATWNKDDGTVKQWSTVRSIGRSAQPLSQLSNDKLADVNDWFSTAAADDESIPF